MDIISMAYAKKLVNGLQSGLDTASVDNDTCSITFQWKNGTSSTMTFPKPLDGANGVGISDVKLKEVTAGSGKETHLICTLEDGTEIDAGNIPVGSGGITNYDDTQIKKDINEVNGKIEALKTSQNLEYEGTDVICNNTLASRTSDMFIKGKTYQNLFRRINSQTTQEQDNNYILTGVANAYSMLSIYPAYNLQKNNKYTVVIDVKNLNVPDGRPFKFDGFNGNTWICGTKIETTGLKKIILQGNQDITEIRLQINNAINSNITISKNIIILKGDWTKKEVPTSITGIESAGQKENKISILSNNNKPEDDINHKEYKKEILLPIEGGLKSLPNGVADTIEQRSDGVYLVQRVKKETYVNGDENNNNYLTDKVNTYKPLAAPVETKLGINNLDLEVYKDTTCITTENAIQPTLNFKVPSNLGGIMQENSQNINKLYKLIDEVIIQQLINNSADIEILKLK